MNILPIVDVQQQHSFKGLWGSTVKDKTVSEFECFIHVTKNYYPFKDEALCDINSVVSKNSTYRTSNSRGYLSGYTSGVDVIQRLPFTQKEYKEYKSLQKSPLDKNGLKVENALGQNKLYKYINNKPRFFLNLFINKIKKITKK